MFGRFVCRGESFRYFRLADLSWPVILLAMLGKFFNCIAFSLVYLVASEVYSTNIRGLGLCFNSTMARIGATVGVYAGLLVRVRT